MDFDAPDMATQREDVSRMDTARKGSRAWLILTLVAFPLLALVVALLNAGVSTVTQTKSAGQCDFTTKTFNARQEAFTLAQNVEQYWSTKLYDLINNNQLPYVEIPSAGESTKRISALTLNTWIKERETVEHA